MQMKAKAAIILDTRRIKKDKTYPVKLRVTYERKQQYYPIDFNLTETAFERTMFGQRQTADEKQLKRTMQAIEDKAADIINKLPLFDWNKFENLFFTNRAAKDTLNAAFDDYAKALRAEGRIGTAVTYECAQNSLNKYKPGAKFAEITPTFLHSYEKRMVANGCSITTVGIYLRSLRTLFSAAVADGLLTKDAYPFGKKRYEIPTGHNVKKALTLNDIAAIYSYPTAPGSTAEMAKSYWLFMYFCNGMNMKDLCLLQYDNIKGNVLEFERAKTARTKRKVETIRVPLCEDAKEIIASLGNPKENGSTFIFPVLTKGLTPVRQRELIQLKTHLVNEHMKAIAVALGIDSNVTTYVARHSFATILQRSGVPVSFISEALGHGNVQTTQNYLAGFEDESKAETLKALTAFKKIKSATTTLLSSEQFPVASKN